MKLLNVTLKISTVLLSVLLLSACQKSNAEKYAEDFCDCMNQKKDNNATCATQDSTFRSKLKGDVKGAKIYVELVEKCLQEN